MPAKIVLTPYEIEKLIDYYYLPRSIAAVSRKFGMSESTVKRILEENSVPPHTKEEIIRSKTETTSETNLKKYGHVNAFQSPKSVENRQAFYEDREKVAESVRKNKNTRFKNHGNPNYNNIAQMKETRKKKYGVENFFQDSSIHQKALERARTKESKEKRKQTCLEHYGVEYSLAAPEVREEIRNTCLEKYGASSYIASPEMREQITKHTIETTMERYGVAFPCQTPPCQAACKQTDSRPNLKFAEMLTEAGIEFTREYPIGRKLYDFEVGNILVEINPSATHNIDWGVRGDVGQTKEYHLEKTEIARDAGFRCIHVWDWDDFGVVIDLLRPRETIYARKCAIREVNEQDEKDFLNRHHLQGYVKSSVCLGLYDKNRLISLMSFGKPRYNSNYQWELLRYCSSANIIGGAKKLFKNFLSEYNPESIVSYCDLSKFTGDVYADLRFSLLRTSGPSRHWYNMKTKTHITDNLLRQRGFDQLFGADYGRGTSNDELMLSHGFVEIYDCGQATYSYKKNQ